MNKTHHDQGDEDRRDIGNLEWRVACPTCGALKWEPCVWWVGSPYTAVLLHPSRLRAWVKSLVGGAS
jgi:hypothetical protein